MNRMPAQGDTLTMRRAAASVTVGRQLNQGAQGVVYEATMGETLLALKWLRPGPHSAALKRSIAALTERPRPHKAFIWPIDLVNSTELEGFGYVMPYMTSRFISFAQMLKNEPSFRVLIRIGRNLVDAFAALHSSGHCYRDISFRNLYVDPVSAEVAICDNDNVGLDDGEVFVKGSNEFMAPEVLRDELFPCTATDLYSLAVFLFIVFVRGHPLEGALTSSMYSWAEEHHISTDQLMRRNFGSEPLFVFDPADDSNRPPPGDAMLTYWSIYPQFFRELFEKAFTTGLRTPSVSARVTPSAWRRALVRLSDLTDICSCAAEIFWDPDDPSHMCWNCLTVLPTPDVLEVGGHTVVLCEGATVTSHHLLNDRSYDEALGVVERHPDKPGCFTLRNMSDSTWIVVPDGDTQKTVVPTQRLYVRPMSIDFGPVQGRIT
jgi:eukaryotic-like serine/threonine-protein kinase